MFDDNFITFHNKKNTIEYEIVENPMGLIEFTLNKDEKITAEAGAMVFIKGNIRTETRMRKRGFKIP